jgi:hypothetical protein
LRAKELALATGVPSQFEVLYEEDVIDVNAAERLIHEKLSGYRINPKREFFLVPLKLAVRAVFETCVQINADNQGKAGARVVLFLRREKITMSQLRMLRERIKGMPRGSASLYLIIPLEDRVVHMETDEFKISLDAAQLNSIRDLQSVTDVMIVHGKRRPTGASSGRLGPLA